MQLCDNVPVPPPTKGSPMSAPVVLILNGSDPLRAAMGLHLAVGGYTVRTAGTAAEAAAAIDRAPADVAIVEHLKSGLDATDLLRRLARTRAVPVVLITESAAVRHLPQDALPAVAEVLVRNRFTLPELDRAVAKAVRRP